MREVTDEFLLALAGIAATLVGTFIVAVFFYLDSALHRSRGAAGSTPDQYMRAGTRWVLIAYSLPLIVALALVGAEPVWAAVAFSVFAAALVVATVDTTRRIVKRGATGKSPRAGRERDPHLARSRGPGCPAVDPRRLDPVADRLRPFSPPRPRHRLHQHRDGHHVGLRRRGDVGARSGAGGAVATLRDS